MFLIIVFYHKIKFIAIAIVVIMGMVIVDLKFKIIITDFQICFDQSFDLCSIISLNHYCFI